LLLLFLTSVSSVRAWCIQKGFFDVPHPECI
jgi:hypothetical protein